MKKKTSISLRIENLTARIGEKEILHGITLTIPSGEVHAIMGPNGSGKSTLSHVLMGHPAYEVGTAASKVFIGNTNLLSLPPEERAKAGLFLAFQSPIAIPGVTVMNLLRTAYQEVYKDPEASEKHIENPVLARRWKGHGVTIQEFMVQVKEAAKSLHVPDTFLSRSVHDAFSGGEKKKVEMLQALVLKPKFAIFDEIDTGLDVDALRVVAQGIDLLRKQGTGVMVITHYQRILHYVNPDRIHVLANGKLVESGTADLARKIEEEGYSKYL